MNINKLVGGVPAPTAFSVAVECGDLSRFRSARALMSLVGLVPPESSSGESASRGGITRAGNPHVRRLLVEAAWRHERPPGCSPPRPRRGPPSRRRRRRRPVGGSARFLCEACADRRDWTGGNPQPESRNALANTRMSDSHTRVHGTMPGTPPAAGG
ncbi:transposase [Olsenella sp. Marseille-P4559]|uniref:transposase n=1 Tax=Olsenella sp. Marseille-P4559 TaxID=2364795 RepID=UPI0013EF5834